MFFTYRISFWYHVRMCMCVNMFLSNINVLYVYSRTETFFFFLHEVDLENAYNN